MGHYLYYELLKLVNVEAMNQINNLDENLMKMASEQRSDWLALTKWNIPNEYETARQDIIVNGIASRYTFDQLSTSSGTTFNSPQFYDYNQYLSQLVLLAQIMESIKFRTKEKLKMVLWNICAGQLNLWTEREQKHKTIMPKSHIQRVRVLLTSIDAHSFLIIFLHYFVA